MAFSVETYNHRRENVINLQDVRVKRAEVASSPEGQRLAEGLVVSKQASALALARRDELERIHDIPEKSDIDSTYSALREARQATEKLRTERSEGMNAHGNLSRESAARLL